MSESNRDLPGASAINSPAAMCCLWCGRSFAPRRTGGSKQLYCCAAHRHALGSAARAWAIAAVEAGVISVSLLKAGVSSARASRGAFHETAKGEPIAGANSPPGNKT